MLRTEEPGAVKRLHRGALGADFQVLANPDERRHGGIPRPQRSRHDRAEVRHRDRLRRHVPGVPVILMARVEDEPEIRGLKRANERAAIHHARDALQPLRDLDVIDGRIDRRKRAQHALGPHARLERRVAFRIEGLGLSHPASHPQHDDRVG